MSKNIVYPYIQDFILQNTKINISKELLEIEKNALKNNIPVINAEVQKLLEWILSMKNPSRILEIGCAVGFSSIFMSEVLNHNVCITTIEKDKNRIEEAIKNFQKFPASNINLIQGDYFEKSNEITDTFDFIFVDSSKSHYEKIFKESIGNLDKNGIILFDNVLFKGLIANDDLVNKRNRTIVRSMRSFINYVVNLEEFSVIILPINDGIAIIRRIN